MLRRAVNIRQPCEICFTHSWAPVLKDDPEGLEVLAESVDYKVVCQYCQMHQFAMDFKEAIKHILRYFGHPDTECFTLPNGNCVGVACIHTLTEIDPPNIEECHLELLPEEENTLHDLLR